VSTLKKKSFGGLGETPPQPSKHSVEALTATVGFNMATYRSLLLMV